MTNTPVFLWTKPLEVHTDATCFVRYTSTSLRWLSRAGGYIHQYNQNTKKKVRKHVVDKSTESSVAFKVMSFRTV